MIAHNLNALDLLTLPVWIVSPDTEELLFANRIAREVMQGYTFSQLRKGVYSTHAQTALPNYITDLRNHRDIVEILTVLRENNQAALTCRLSIKDLPDSGK